MQFDFDYYFIEKPDYVLVLLFDAVFDAGLNEAVKWDVYWTPLRYRSVTVPDTPNAPPPRNHFLPPVSR